MSEVVVFGPKAAERTQAVVKRVENTIYPSTDTRSKWPVVSGVGVNVVDGIVTTAITPFNTSNNTYGVGNVQAIWPIFNSNTNSYVAGNNNGVGNVVVYMRYNNNGVSIPTNTRCKIVQQQTANGGLIWEFLGSDC
jgi:hypothetical protein